MFTPLLVVTVGGCELGGDGGGDGDTGGPDTYFFSEACTATLLQPVALQERTGPERWTLTAAMGQVGQQVLLATDRVNWHGYLFVDGEVTARVATAPFQLGTHFSADCAGEPVDAETEKVVLMDSTLYESKDLSGTPCIVEAGTVVAGGYAFMDLDDGVASVAGELVSAVCGLDLMYSADFVTDELARRP